MQTPDITVFNIVVGALFVVFGFLLNRVFSEIDKINAAAAKFKEDVLTGFIDKPEFIRHSETEVRLMERMSNEIGKRFDKIDILLEAVRVKQHNGE